MTASLDIIGKHDVETLHRSRWSAARAWAARQIAGAATVDDARAIIRTVLTDIGDEHGSVIPAQPAGTAGGCSQQLPSGHTDGQVGYLTLPGLSCPPASATSRRYARSAWGVLRRCAAGCGWVVDLRADTGGDAWPMLATIAPLLPTSRPVGVRGSRDFAGWFTVTGGTVAYGGHSTDFGTPPKVAARRVAVLIGTDTFSAGEWTLLALASRGDGVRTFGEPTRGGPTSPRLFRLPDGASIRVSTGAAVTVDERVHLGPTMPDELLPVTGPEITRAAARWTRVTG